MQPLAAFLPKIPKPLAFNSFRGYGDSTFPPSFRNFFPLQGLF